MTGKIVSFFVWIAGFMVVLFLLSRLFLGTMDMGYLIFSNQAKDIPKYAVESAITVREGESLLDIGKDLERKKIVDDARVFAAAAWTMDDHDRIMPGEYSVSSSQKPSELIETFVGEEEP